MEVRPITYILNTKSDFKAMKVMVFFICKNPTALKSSLGFSNNKITTNL